MWLPCAGERAGRPGTLEMRAGTRAQTEPPGSGALLPGESCYQLLEAPPPPELPPPPEKPPPPPENPPPPQLPPPPLLGSITHPCCFRNFVPVGLCASIRRIGNRITHAPPMITPPHGG